MAAAGVSSKFVYFRFLLFFSFFVYSSGAHVDRHAKSNLRSANEQPSKNIPFPIDAQAEARVEALGEIQ